MLCKNCGKELKMAYKYCPVCGSPIPGPEAPPAQKAPEESAALPKRKRKISLPQILVLVLIVLILFVTALLLGVLGNGPRKRLEEQLRLGAAYLEEMKYDMALDAYAAAIEIDENDYRAYLGRAEVYTVMADRTIEEALTEEDLDKAAENLDLAKKDLDRAEELLEERGQDPAEEAGDTLAERRKELEDAGNRSGLKRFLITGESIDAVAAETLGLPYIGNTGYSERLAASGPDLYDGAGYISAVLADPDGDSLQEILVVSLEGEDTLGEGTNALYLHVLEYDGSSDSWTGQAKRNLEEDPSLTRISTARTADLTRDIFLRQENGVSAIYIESVSYGYGEGEAAWSLFRYIYNGSEIQLSPIGENAAADAEGLFLPSTALGREDPLLAALQRAEAAGLPVLDGDQPVPGIMYNDSDSTAFASFERRPEDGDPAATRVRLIDWSIHTDSVLLLDDPYEAEKFWRAYIRDILAAEYGYYKLAPQTLYFDQNSYRYTSSDPGWDTNTGILGADILDMTGNGKMDLVVYRMEIRRDYGTDYQTLIGSLYTEEEGAVVHQGDSELTYFNIVQGAGITRCGGFLSCRVGIIYADEKPYIWTEHNSNAYFANGAEFCANFTGWDGERFRLLMTNGKTDGGSSDIAYSLQTFNSDGTSVKNVFWADDGFWYYADSDPLVTNISMERNISTEADAVTAGYRMLGLPDPVQLRYPQAYYEIGAGAEIFPTYWSSDSLKASIEFGTRGNRGNTCEYYISDFTNLMRQAGN